MTITVPFDLYFVLVLLSTLAVIWTGVGLFMLIRLLWAFLKAFLGQ